MLLEKGNVAVSPGSGFGPAGEGFLRMSLVENEARLRQAVRQIQHCLREVEAQFSNARVVRDARLGAQTQRRFRTVLAN